MGYALKREGYTVDSNDHNSFAYHLAQCYVACDREDLPADFDKIIDHLNQIPGQAGFFTDTYCIKSRFFHPKNGEKIDAIRQEIEQISVSDKVKSVLLVSLMEAADRIDSTCGIQMAYLKTWAKRALLPLTLRTPLLLARGKSCRAHCLDALTAAQKIICDVTYLDPPYNQHSYRGNYHIWETLVRFDSPVVYGKAHKRMDCKTEKSSFNSKRTFKESLLNVLKSLASQYIVLSFNDEGFISKNDLEDLLSEFGKVSIFEIDYKRYVGAQIGIFNHQGIKVGNIKRLYNIEFLYVVNREGKH